MTELSPTWEKLAQNYALRIKKNDLTIDNVPNTPAFLKPRVIEILLEMENELTTELENEIEI